MKWLTGEPVILVDRAAMAEAPAADGTRDKLLVAIGPGLDHENSTT